MRLRRLALAGILVLAAGPGLLLADGNANFFLGGRSLVDEEFWTPGEDQGVFGVTVEFAPSGWPISLAAGTHIGGAEEETQFFGFTETWRTAVVDFTFGVRKVWKAGRNRPYVGGGLALVGASAELEVFGVSVDDDDQSGGAYLEGGIFWKLGSRFNLGMELRSLFGTDVEFDFGGPVAAVGDADYAQFGLVLGWGWPPE